MNMDGCVRTTKNGACKGRSLSYAVGPKHLTLCRRHRRQYDEQRADLLRRTLVQHDQGLHGEGEERREFSLMHEDSTGEYLVYCSKCRDEIQAEELGVPADDVDRAQRITWHKEQCEEQAQKARDRFMEQWKRAPAYAVENYGNDVLLTDKELELWLSVDNEMKRDRYEEGFGKPATHWNIVQAYDHVAARTAERLLRNTLGDGDRAAAAEFIKAGRVI